LHKIAPVEPKKLIKALTKIGFKPVRQKGSHVILVNEKGTRVIVPVHPGRDVKPGIVRAIISEVGMERGRFPKLLE